MPSSSANGLPPSSYPNYDTPPSNAAANGGRIKQEPGVDSQYNGLPNGYPQAGGPPQGGLARAQQLVQQQYGQAANASLSAMQRGGGLALPGQQQAKPQGLQLPAHSPQQGQPQYSPQQQQAMRQQQQQQLAQQQAQPRIKVENDSPRLGQGSFPPQTAPPNYSQTDGADDALEQWQTMLAQRRAISAEQMQRADRMMREHVMQNSAELQSGLMVPLDEQPSNKRLKRQAAVNTSSNQRSSSSVPAIPQLDGDVDEDEEKPDIKDEDDENAINSDLDDSDDDGQGNMGDDDDEFVDSILCTYDKVQRVKNKWKCTLKDGIMSVNGKEWVFHKGMGEFEW